MTMQLDDKPRIREEQETIDLMIRLYCRRKEGNAVLCPACEELRRYAFARLERCPFGERKTTCRLCSIHCYRTEMRERMRTVMRYAGPRMLWYHPVALLRHFWREWRPREFATDVASGGKALDASVAEDLEEKGKKNPYFLR